MKKQIILEDILSRVNSSLLKINKTLEEGGGGGGGQGMTVINATLSREDDTLYINFTSLTDVDTVLNNPENVVVVGTMSEEGGSVKLFLLPVMSQSDSVNKMVMLCAGLPSPSNIEYLFTNVHTNGGLKYALEETFFGVPRNAYVRVDDANNKIYVKNCDSSTFSELSPANASSLINLFEYGSINASSLMDGYSGITIITFESDRLGFPIVKCSNLSGKYQSTQPGEFEYYGPVLEWRDSGYYEQLYFGSSGDSWYVNMANEPQE